MTKNKNLLITGAATRVGKAIALHFAGRGWNIALHYFRSSSKAKKLKKVIEQNWVKATLIKADLKNPKQAEKIMSLARKKLGTIDSLINNAALFEKEEHYNSYDSLLPVGQTLLKAYQNRCIVSEYSTFGKTMHT